MQEPWAAKRFAETGAGFGLEGLPARGTSLRVRLFGKCSPGLGPAQALKADTVSLRAMYSDCEADPWH